MEIVMKKIFYILLASLVLFFSCDPHNPENNLTINFDNDTLNKILSESSARFADPKDGYPLCLYAVLKGSNGTKYEKSMYFQGEDPQRDLFPDGASITFDLSRVSFRENYDLYVYIVQNGSSILSGTTQNIELNKYGPTYVNVRITPAIFVDFPNTDLNISAEEDSSGNYVINYYDDDSTFSYSTGSTPCGNSAYITLSHVYRPYYSYEENCSFEVYVIHNGKETKIPLSHINKGDNDNYEPDEYIYKYTITSPGYYTFALRITDSSIPYFRTFYKNIEFKSNIVDTNYVIYDNNYNTRTNVWLKSSLDESGLPDNNPTYFDAAANNFDFCFGSGSDIYVTDGTNIYKNWVKEPAFATSGEGITITAISYDPQKNYIVLCGIKQGSRYVGVSNVYNYYTGIKWVPAPSTSYNYTLTNIAANNGDAYLFYNYQDEYDSSKNHLIVYAYPIEENKPGTGVMDILTSPNDLMTVYKIASLPFENDLNYYGGYPYFSISDTLVKNNCIYFVGTCSQLSGYDYIAKFGFTGKINLSEDTVSIIGQPRFQKQSLPDLNYANSYYYTYSGNNLRYGKDDSSLKEFINPQRIIALKPKSLIIADDGTLYWDFNGSDGKYKNSNRAVTVDLDSFIVDSIKTLDNITWLEEPTQDFSCQSGEQIYYTPN